MPGHTEQSVQGLHSLPFRFHLLGALLYRKTTLFKLLDNYSNFLLSEFFGFLQIRKCVMRKVSLVLWVNDSSNADALPPSAVARLDGPLPGLRMVTR